jgi:proteic killer suppression protein
MRFRFADANLEMIYTTGVVPKRYGPDVVNAFVKTIVRIDAARDERDPGLRGGSRYKKLKGSRAGQYSVRLNQQWRLILRPDRDADGNFMWIIELVDYH